MIRLYLPPNNTDLSVSFINKVRLSFVKILISIRVLFAFIPAKHFFYHRLVRQVMRVPEESSILLFGDNQSDAHYILFPYPALTCI